MKITGPTFLWLTTGQEQQSHGLAANIFGTQNSEEENNLSSSGCFPSELSKLRKTPNISTYHPTLILLNLSIHMCCSFTF